MALIEYSGGLPSGAVALPLARPSSPRVTEFFSGGGKTPRSITALGYGRTTGKELTDGNDLGGSGLLRIVELPVSQFDRNGVTFTVDQKKEKGVCFGDSGGPALLASERLDDQPKLQLIGVASGVFSDEGVDEYALGFDPCAQNSLYTNIIPYLDWIDAIEKSVSPAPTTASARSANPNRN